MPVSALCNLPHWVVDKVTQQEAQGLREAGQVGVFEEDSLLLSIGQIWSIAVKSWRGDLSPSSGEVLRASAF